MDYPTNAPPGLMGTALDSWQAAQAATNQAAQDPAWAQQRQAQNQQNAAYMTAMGAAIGAPDVQGNYRPGGRETAMDPSAAYQQFVQSGYTPQMAQQQGWGAGYNGTEGWKTMGTPDAQGQAGTGGSIMNQLGGMLGSPPQRQGGTPDVGAQAGMGGTSMPAPQAYGQSYGQPPQRGSMGGGMPAWGGGYRPQQGGQLSQRAPMNWGGFMQNIGRQASMPAGGGQQASPYGQQGRIPGGSGWGRF